MSLNINENHTKKFNHWFSLHIDFVWETNQCENNLIFIKYCNNLVGYSWLAFYKKLSKFPFPNCQNFLFQTVKISLFKLSKFPFSNCQNFPFQTVKISLSKLSKYPFPNCQNFPFQTVKISLSKNCQIEHPPY
jgi:hypothetical protein